MTVFFINFPKRFARQLSAHTSATVHRAAPQTVKKLSSEKAVIKVLRDV